MRIVVCLAACTGIFAQAPDPAYTASARAYDALRARDYEAAVAGFLAAIEAAPTRAGIRKDLAYTYLKIGENDLARGQFREAIHLDPGDAQVALEYAFLANEARGQAEARRIFDRIRRTAPPPHNATAERAFQNIDGPLAAGIERWKTAIAAGADNFSAHFELATLAERRDELALAAEHFEKAWRILPDRRSVLVDLGRVWKAMGRDQDANAALLAASRGGEPHAAELARELLPARYPYVPEFRRALALDPANFELRRELAYLFLRMEQQPEAEDEFHILTETAPEDLLSATQLGFLLHARGEHAAAQPLFDRVLAGGDEDLANRVRAVLRLPQVLQPRAASQPASIDAKVMAERSIKAGYLKDALKYLEVAHEADPGDFDVMFKLGWTLNILHQDRRAFQWFGLARRSADPRIAGEAERAWKNLRPANERVLLTGWFYPMYSSRWRAAFSYAQVRAEIRPGSPLRPYVSARLAGDSAFLLPQSLSERSVILAGGVTTPAWRGARAWFEAGGSLGYSSHRILPDYRGGLSYAHGFAALADTTLDAVYVSRFQNDFLIYSQSRFGRVAGPVQLYWNAAVTADAQRQYWANSIETGPGIRIGVMPGSFVTLNLLRGAYLVNRDNPRCPNFTDVRAGFWYGFSR